MLDWLLSWFRRDERCLFRYWDGSRRRAIDPVAAYRLLWTSPDCDLVTDAATARNPLKEDGEPLYPIGMVYEAENRLRSMTRTIFGVKEWTETTPGLTVDETDELLNSFMAFCGELKKKRNTSPIASAPTESRGPPDCTDTGDCPDGVDPAYCSSANASSAAAPFGL